MTANRNPLTLIGEEISSAWNVAALADIAQAFGGCYVPYPASAQTAPEAAQPPLRSRFDCLLAAENHPAAQHVYGFRPPAQGNHALLVGNEAKGLRRPTLKQAHALLEIPLLSKNLNCLNVAAAAAVLLYYLNLEAPLPLPKRTLSSVQKHRPDLLLISSQDHMELGSALRSACAFGWEHVFLLDRGNAWYACDRKIKSEGRGAARRGRNPLRVVPYDQEMPPEYRKIIVVTRAAQGKSLPALSLTGSDVLIVLEDEAHSAAPWLPPYSSRTELLYAALPPISPDRYHYRQMASIALAEIARQLGWPDSEGIYLRSRKQRYRRAVEAEETEILLDLEDLRLF
jgi:hypothetical protein